MHLAYVAADGDTAEGFGDVSSEATFFVVGEDLFEVVHAAEVVTVAFAVAVAFELDVIKKGLTRPNGRRVFDHAGECEGCLVEGPAVEGFEIDRGRLDVVVYLEGVVAVRGAADAFADGHGALAERLVGPVFPFRFGAEPVEFGFASEDGRPWKARFAE